MAQLTPSAQSNFVTAVVLMVLTGLAVSMRLGIRFSMGQTLFASDWLCLASLAFFYAFCIVMIYFIYNVSVAYAFDPDPFTYGPMELRNLLLYSFVLEILMTFVVTLVKFSILWFYHTIFGINKTVKYVIYGTGAACAIWFIIALLPLIVFQCNPVNAYWEMFNMPPACPPTQNLLLGYELSNFFLDIVILCIPLFVVRDLHLTPAKKIATAVIFLLGIFVCITSAVRLTTIRDAQNPSAGVNFTPSMIWSTIQQGVAIICCCLPAYGPMLRSIEKPISFLTNMYSSRGTKPSKGSSGSGNSASGVGKSSRRSDNAWVKVGAVQESKSSQWTDSSFHDSNEHILDTLDPSLPRGAVTRGAEMV